MGQSVGWLISPTYLSTRAVSYTSVLLPERLFRVKTRQLLCTQCPRASLSGWEAAGTLTLASGAGLMGQPGASRSGLTVTPTRKWILIWFHHLWLLKRPMRAGPLKIKLSKCPTIRKSACWTSNVHCNTWLSYAPTGCSLNIVFFPKILKYSGLWPFSVCPQC